MKNLILTVLIAVPAFAAETVTVRPHEGLMDVSYRVYGTHTRWKDIYEWNKAVIPNPNKVEVGTVLKIERAPVAKAEAAVPPASEPAQPALGTEDSATSENSAAPEPAAPRAPAKAKPPVEKSKPLLPYTELELPQ